jgi:nitrous oxidase accessory protein
MRNITIRLAFLLLPVLIIAFTSAFCDAGTIVVGPREQIRSIRDALERGKIGDTILVRAGRYAEGNLKITKPVILLGEGYPLLDGMLNSEIITVLAANVVIKGFSLVNSGRSGIEDYAAIKVIDGKHVRIESNRISNAFFGVYMANSSFCWVTNNEIEAFGVAEHQTGNGVHMWKCHHMSVLANTIKGHRDGIYFEFVTQSLIEDNRSEGNIRYGLHFMFSHKDEYRRNSFRRNGAGVAVMYTTGVKMIGNTFEDNWGPAAYGLLLKDIRDSEVLNNTFLRNSVAVFMEGSSRIDFRGNEFSSNGYAIRIQASCDDNVFKKNNFRQNTFDVATNGTLVLNTMVENYWDKFDGYDLDKDGTGDVAYHPVSLYGMVVERMPTAVLLWRSMLVFMIDRAEKAIPAVTPENLKDVKPQMRPYDLH